MSDNPNLVSKASSLDETSFKYMMKLSAPMIVTYAAFTVMQFVDRFMVSRLGTEALAAVLPAGVMCFLPASFLLGMMTSVNTFVSQSLGRGEKQNCSNYCWQAIYMGLSYFTVAAAFMWLAAPAIFKAMGHEPAVIEMEVIYLRIVIFAQLVAVFIWATSQFFMGIHRPKTMMYAGLLGQVINIAANYLLIFGKFGFPAMGIAGAAWGTFIGISAEAVVLIAVFLGGKTNRDFNSRGATKIDFSKMRDLLKVGLPAGASLTINVALMGVILFGLVGRFGKEALAATSAVFSCINVAIMPVVGMGVALTATVGKAIGENKKDVAVKQTNVCLRTAMVYMLVIAVGILMFRDGIMRFWSSDPKVVEAGYNILILAVIFQMFDVPSIVYRCSLRGAGDTMYLAVVSAIGAVLILGVGGFLIQKFFVELGALGPWIAATGNVVLVAIANWWRFKSNSWMRIDLFKGRVVTAPIELEAMIE